MPDGDDGIDQDENPLPDDPALIEEIEQQLGRKVAFVISEARIARFMDDQGDTCSYWTVLGSREKRALLGDLAIVQAQILAGDVFREGRAQVEDED